MCRSRIEGHRRCKGSAATKASESLRKAINYQAKKADLSPQDWKDQNPELLELINKSYDERLDKFESKIKNESKLDASEDKQDGISKFVDADGETMLTGIQSPKTAAQKHPIHKYDFAAKGVKRTANSLNDFDEYSAEAEKHLSSLGISKDERKSIALYTSDTYAPVNSYFLNKDEDYFINDQVKSWKESSVDDYKTKFKSEEDLVDYSKKLDSVLSNRAGESRIVYRGLSIFPSSTIIKKNNNGKEAKKTEERREIMERIYTPGAEIAFDAYSSATEQINLATDWCGSHATWGDPPSGILFEIKSSAGIPVASVSRHAEEREILLPRGMKFRVENSYWNTSNEEDCYSFVGNGSNKTTKAKNHNTLIVQLVEVDDAGNEITDHTAKYVAPEVKLRSSQIGTENSK